MVGHCAVRHWAMGERGLDETPASADDIAAMTALVDEAIGAGALGFSTSRTMLHRVPDGRAVPGTYAAPDELLALGDVLGRHDRGTFEVAPKLGERDGDDFAGSRAEVAWMAEINRRTGRPVTFGLAQTSFLPDLHLRVLEFVDDEAARGGQVRPQTTARSIGLLFGISHRTFYDSLPSWRPLQALDLDGRLAALDDDGRRAQLIREAEERPSGLDPGFVYLVGTTRRALRLHAGGQPRLDRGARRRVAAGGVRSARTRERRPGAVQLPVPQPEPRRGRPAAAPPHGDARPRRLRRARRPDHGRVAADVLPLALGARPRRVRPRGRDPPPHVRHGGRLRDRRPGRDPGGRLRRHQRLRPRRAPPPAARVRARLPRRGRALRAARRRLRRHDRQRTRLHARRRAHRRAGGDRPAERRPPSS